MFLFYKNILLFPRAKIYNLNYHQHKICYEF